jgi:hypothetical protein
MIERAGYWNIYVVTKKKRFMCLGVSRDGTRVIALGLITYCKLKGSLIILISDKVQGPMYTT